MTGAFVQPAGRLALAAPGLLLARSDPTVKTMREIPIGARSLDRFARLVGVEKMTALRRLTSRVGARLGDRVIWNMSSTATGGGVAELLRPLIAYARGEGLDVRWAVLGGSPEFFRVTKRLHHALHGSAGDGSPLDPQARRIYEGILRENAESVGQLVRPGDLVILHDPQTAGLAPALKNLGARVIWRCHVGCDHHNGEAMRGWTFLMTYLSDVDHFVFSRKAYVPPGIDLERAAIIAPAIDPFSAKNQELSEENVRAILVHVGLVEGPVGSGQRVFRRDDGTPARVDRGADVVRLGRTPTFDVPLVVQVSRWDRLKDPIGVMEGFAKVLEPASAHPPALLLVGPTVTAVADDPEGGEVFGEVLAAWRSLPHHRRQHVHLVNLPMADVEENAAIVNALQRHARVIIQKSLHEGFGLTVTEAMWKSRPVVASDVGGIREQIRDGVNGLLLENPRDLERFSALIRKLLADPVLSARLGENARKHVAEHGLEPTSLERYGELLLDLLGRPR